MDRGYSAQRVAEIVDMKTALVLGGHGFIGHHLARRLRSEGYWVRVVDIKHYEYGDCDFCDEWVIGDLRDLRVTEAIVRLNEQKKYSFLPTPFEKLIEFDEVYCLAADMGGAGFVFTKEHDFEIIQNSLQINLNVSRVLREQNFKGKIFFSSSACIYPQEIQLTSEVVGLKESDAYPANPDSEYGWEKLIGEHLYLCSKLDVRIARFHNIMGPEGTYKGGREKAPAAMCRKIAEVNDHKMIRHYIEIWGDGKQTRSFLFVEDCIDAVRLLMQSDFKQPINIGSEENVSINELALLVRDISKKKGIKLQHDLDNTALGVRGRNSNNDLIRKVLGWEPKYTLRQGLEKTYRWIEQQINVNR